MKLKKILAVALAATTALSSGVAYDALGAGTAKAADTGYYEKGDTITVTSGSIEYVYTVDLPILDSLKSTEVSNAVYDNGGLKKNWQGDLPTTAGEVKLTSISWENDDHKDTIYVPEYIDSSLIDSGSIDSKVSGEKGQYFVREIDLTGGDDFEDIKAVNYDAARKNLKAVKLEDFANLSTITGYIPEGKAETVNFAGTGVQVEDALTHTGIGGVNYTTTTGAAFTVWSASLETLNLRGIAGLGDGAKYDENEIDIAGTKIKEVNVSSNDKLTGLGVATYRTKGMKLNITDSTNLKYLDVLGAAAYRKDMADDGEVWNLPTCDFAANKGVDFVLDNGDGTKDLDLSSYGELKEVYINYCGLNSFVAPSIQENGKIDVSHNGIKEINLSSAADASLVNVSYNKLTDIDVSGLTGGKLKTLDVSHNYLTSLDISALTDDSKPSSFKMDSNFVSKANLTKADSGQSGLNASNQVKIDKNAIGTVDKYGMSKDSDVQTDFAWAFTGDLGKANASDNKAYIKTGGSGNLIVGVKVLGTPDGFAEKLASTVTFTEANTNGGAISLGEAQVVQAEEAKYEPGTGNLSVVLVAVPVTGAAEKTAAEKVTVNIGGISKNISIGADNVVLVSYDIASSITSDNIKDKNSDNITQAPFYYPTEAFVLGSNGTVKVSANSTAYPNIMPKDPAKTYFNYGAMDSYKMNGLKFSKWNTAVDGTGIAVNYNGKLNDVAEDTTLYAQYTEATYNIKYGKDPQKYFVGDNGSLKKDNRISLSGSTTAQNNVPYGETVAISANGYSTKNGGNFYGWYALDSDKKQAGFYTDGQSTYAFAGQTYSNDRKTKYKNMKYVTLYPVYGDDNHYLTLENNSITLTVGGLTDGAYLWEDLKPVVTGYSVQTRSGDKYNDAEPDLGFGKNTTNFKIISSDDGVVDLDPTNNYLVAKKKGTATVYVIDKHFGNVATVAVEVLGKGETKTDVSDKIKNLEAGQSVVADGGQTVKLNADGKTVTITKGKNQKTVKINTVTIDGVTYKVTAIAAGAYKGMSKIQTVVIGNNVKTIGKIAFANCKNLKKVTMGKNITKIGVRCFKNDKKLAKVLIKSKKLTKTSTVGKNAFQKTKSGVKFYIAKKAATFKKVKKVLKAQGGAKKASYVKKYA